MRDGTCGDEAINARANGVAGAPRPPVEVDSCYRRPAATSVRRSSAGRTSPRAPPGRPVRCWKPCSTSWTTGRHVTTSSKSTTRSRRTPAGFRKTSIQTEVVNEQHCGCDECDRRLDLRASTARSPSHRPEPANSRIWRALARRTKSVRARSTVREYVRSPLKRIGLLEQLFVKHKICAFHTHQELSRTAPEGAVQRPSRRSP